MDCTIGLTRPVLPARILALCGAVPWADLGAIGRRSGRRPGRRAGKRRLATSHHRRQSRRSPREENQDGASFIHQKRRHGRHTGGGIRTGVRAERAGGQVAPRVELPAQSGHDLRRRRDDQQARGGRDQQQVPDPGLRGRRDRSSVRRGRCRAERDRAVLPTRRPTTSSARTRRSRSPARSRSA